MADSRTRIHALPRGFRAGYFGAMLFLTVLFSDGIRQYLSVGQPVGAAICALLLVLMYSVWVWPLRKAPVRVVIRDDHLEGTLMWGWKWRKRWEDVDEMRRIDQKSLNGRERLLVLGSGVSPRELRLSDKLRGFDDMVAQVRERVRQARGVDLLAKGEGS